MKIFWNTWNKIDMHIGILTLCYGLGIKYTPQEDRVLKACFSVDDTTEVTESWGC